MHTAGAVSFGAHMTEPTLTAGQRCLALANCAACPLRETLSKSGEWAPVPAELNASPTVLVSAYPEKQEVAQARPFVGHAAAEATPHIRKAGAKRQDLSYTNVIACRYPNDDKELYLNVLKKKNKARKRRGEEPLPMPAECCRPRLQKELELHKNVIAFGSDALQAVGVESDTGGRPTLRDYRGFPTYTSRGQRLLATVNFAHRELKWRDVLAQDISKAFRYFKGKTTWRDPKILYKPTAMQVRAFIQALRSQVQPVVYDVETAPYTYVTEEETDKHGNVRVVEKKPLFDGLRDKLRCIGFSTENLAIIIPFLPVGGEDKQFFTDADGNAFHTRYSSDEESEIRDLLRELFTDKGILKIGHNAGSYDEMVVRANFGVTVAPLDDTILIHQLGDSEHHHRLAFIASLLTDIPPWKSEHGAANASNDEDLWFYCARDCKCTYVIRAPLIEKAKKKEQYHLLPLKRKAQDCGVGMHTLGLFLDEQRRQEHEARLEKDAGLARKRIVEAAGDSGFNPNSTQQLGRLLFEDWSLPIQVYTDTGEPSTGDEALRKLMSNPLLTPSQQMVIRAIRDFRTADKMLGTYVRKWKRNGAYVDGDGRLRPDFSAHGTVGWRYSSSNPNMQNCPKELRDCFVAPDGFMFVGADYDQLELRMVSAIAGAQYYLDAFENNMVDVHNLSGELVFGDAYYDIEGAPEDHKKKGTGKFAKRRGSIKGVVFASLYGAAAPTVHEIINAMQMDTLDPGEEPLTLNEVRYIQRMWISKMPELKAFWEKCVQQYRKMGWVAEPIHGLRRYFANGEKFNEIVNFPIQAGGGAVVNDAMFDLVYGKNGKPAPLPFDFTAGTGLCLQVHDALTFIVREAEAAKTEDILVEYMTKKYDVLPVTFTVEPGTSKRLEDGFDWEKYYKRSS
jgi:DNA polymerase I-like protein with 3'-5' exonuclease and polymerase domains/uracil-DNA glycosylase